MPAQHQATSADFGSTRATVEVQVPERIVHPQVIGSGTDEAFSASRKHAVHICQLPSRTISMSIGDLDPGARTNEHRHDYETMMYILEGEGYSLIEGERHPWRAGDALYVPPWAWHQHVNTGTTLARYLAATNATLLQNLGNIARREER